ncbi:hypothetical protein BOTNAR_0166g00020 [Botryotinia narcissicola]|uniref:Uncharacterized protein n=1 Tax=Botryotinia narcissicola TaxID=278944 RepID=A0A4Z1IFH2_9HELO|nr:hypothetical protein BOTNAR_0166g00020 [Botryotinia narcissicola]
MVPAPIAKTDAAEPLSNVTYTRLEDQIKLLEARNSQGSQISPSSNPSSNSVSEDSSVETISSHGATTSLSPASATWLSTVSWERYPSVDTPEMSTNQYQSNSAPTFSPGPVPSFQELSKSIDADQCYRQTLCPKFYARSGEVSHRENR